MYEYVYLKILRIFPIQTGYPSYCNVLDLTVVIYVLVECGHSSCLNLLVSAFALAVCTTCALWLYLNVA